MVDLMFWTGVMFWVIILILGLYLLVDILLWRVADIFVKKWKLQNDLFAFVKDRWQKRSGRHPRYPA